MILIVVNGDGVVTIITGDSYCIINCVDSDDVISGAATDYAAAAFEGDNNSIDTIATVHGVGSIINGDSVGARPAIHCIVAGLAVQCISTDTAVDSVIAGAASNSVHTATAGEGVGNTRPDQSESLVYRAAINIFKAGKYRFRTSTSSPMTPDCLLRLGRCLKLK